MNDKINFLKNDFLGNHELYHNMDGVHNMEGVQPAEGMYADAIPAVAPINKTVTFVVTLTNGATSALTTGLAFFGFYTNFAAVNYGLNASITATSYSNVTYPELLALSASEPFEVAETLIQCSSTTQLTATTSMTLTTKDGDGRSNTKVINLKKAPDQYQTDQLVTREIYRIDGFTTITIPQLVASAGITFYFTVVRRASLAGAAFSGGAVKDYSKAPVLLKS